MNHAVLDHDFWMHRALAEARRGLGAVEPNPMVGAVVVQEGRLVAVGHHERFGGPHAEIVAIDRAGSAIRGSTLYVTLEPCCHQGKTPPCTSAIVAAGLARVIVAMRDPFPQVNGGGLARLRQAGIAVEMSVMAEAAWRLNAAYLKRLATDRPFVTAKWAMTLDGKSATATGQSRWISGARSRALVHELRGRMDAILVGVGTVLADDPMLTARPAGPRVATRVVLDSTGRTPPACQLVQSARQAPVLIVTGKAALSSDKAHRLRAAGCEVIGLPLQAGSIPIPCLLDELGWRGMTNVLVEGGGRVLGSFLDAGEVDAVEIFLAPILEGGDHAMTPARGAGVAAMSGALRLDRSETAVLDGDIWVRGTIRREWWNIGGSPDVS